MIGLRATHAKLALSGLGFAVLTGCERQPGSEHQPR